MQDNNTPQTTPEAPVAPPAAQTPPPAPLNTTQTPPPPAPSAPKKGVPKAVKVVLGIVIGLIVLIGIGIVVLILVVNAATKAPLDVSNKFFDDIQANQPAAAYQLTSAGFKESTTEAQLGSLFSQISPFVTGEEKVTAKKIESSNGVNQAAVTYSVENSGETRYARIVLKETDSKWEVLNFKTSTTALEAIIE